MSRDGGPAASSPRFPARLAPRRDLDRRRDDGRGPGGRGRGAARSFEETGRDGSPYRLRLVRHDPDDFDRYYNVFANPTLWFLQHYLWDLARAPSRSTRRCTRPGRATRRVNEAFADAVLEELEAAPDAPVWFHDYHLYLAPRARPARPPGGDACPTSSTSRGRSPTTGRVLPGARCGVRSTRGCSPTTSSGFHTQPLARQLSRSRPQPFPAPPSTRRRAPSSTRDGARSSLRTRSPSTRPSSPSWRAATPFSRPSATSRGCGPSGSCSASIGPIRRRTSSAASRPSGSSSSGIPRRAGRVGMLALLDPSRQDIPQYAEYARGDRGGRAGGERALRRPARGRRSSSRSADDFPRSVAAYKQYDVLLRQRRLRRAEPGRQGGAARERARRRARPVRERRRARGARRVGADGEPLRRRRAGRRDPRGARASRRRAPGAGGGDPRARAASTISSRLAGRAARRSGSASRRPDAATIAGRERPLARGRGRRRPHGRRRRQAGLAAAGGGGGDRPDGAGDRAPAPRAARRATRSSPRSSPGSWRRSGPRS